MTVDANGHRLSSFDAFLPLKVATARHNLDICPNTIVTSLDIQETEDGHRAVGVFIDEEVASSSRQPAHICARREVILCAGAIATPQILMLRCVVLANQGSGNLSDLVVLAQLIT